MLSASLLADTAFACSGSQVGKNFSAVTQDPVQTL